MSGFDPNRRQALRTLGVVGAAGALAVPALLAGEAAGQSAPSGTKQEAKPEAPPQPAADQAKEPSAEAKRLGEIARERYGQHLDEAQWKELIEDIDGNLQSAAQLRKARLRNADEPDSVFRVDR